VENAGLNAAEFLKKNRDIISLIHLKDGKKGQGEAVLTAIGEGEINIGEVIKAAEEIGLTSVIIENDNPKPNGIENMKITMKNLKEIFKI
jgi:sugar phosphate isomerase/epimerase